MRNRSKLTTRWRLAAPMAMAMALGCGEEASEPAALSVPATPIAAAAARAQAATDATAQAAGAEEQAASGTPNVTEEPAVAYEAPFPDREDPFQPPKQASRLARTSNGETADTVVLMGFANLDGPRVVLAINGVVKPLADGEEAAGVKVISIAPPKAVLQRGRSRWTASLQ